jgi:zinc protease
MALVSELYPADHPYHWLTIGAAEDLRAAHVDDVREFFKTYYHPQNASLALAGDVDLDDALRLADEYFGSLPPGIRPGPVRPTAPLERARETRLVLEDRVELARLYLAWHSPKLFATDDAELDLVADVLAGGKTSRLYRALVYDQRIATEVAASQNSRELSGYFQVVATAAPGHSLAEIDAAITREVQRVAADGPTIGEIERGVAQAEAHFISRLQTVGGFGGKSDQLNAYNVFLGDASFFDRDLDRYRRAEAAGLTGAAERWLQPSARVALSVVPSGRLELALEGSRPVAVS